MSTFKNTALLSAAVIPLSLASCTTMGGGAIPNASAPISATEAQQGAEAHPQLLEQFGGTYSGPQAAYVEQVGKNIAVQSGLGNARDSFTVSLLNSSVNNAFAVPGGYIYTTRQLVGLMNNEAELAGVLGHEVGHVAARHSQRRQSAAQKNTLLGAAGAILSGVLLGDSGIGQTISKGFLQGSQLLTLKFSRSQELQADELGIQYLNSAGYDPRAMATVLQSLAAQNSLDASLQGSNAAVPEWASTHPDPASRVQTAFAKAGAASGTTNRETFLSRIDGLMYGDDPAQGVIEGRQFMHPAFRLAFTAPSGFYMVNGSRAVSINGEKPANALVREIDEELGITLDAASIMPAHFAEETVEAGKTQIVILLYTLAGWTGQEPVQPSALEGGAVGWFTPAEIELLDKPPLDILLARQLFGQDRQTDRN